MRCPNCGANLKLNQETHTYICDYCGYKADENPRVVEKVVYTNTGSYNLLISHRAQNVISTTVSYKILDSGQSGTLSKDETTTFNLSPGAHKVALSYGNYKETYVVIIQDNAPVEIYYNGGKGFQVCQPDAGEATKGLTNGKYSSKTTGLSIAALILSASVIGSVLGILLAGIDIKRSNSKGNNPCTVAIIALMLGILTGCILLTMIAH